jgi:hypothetical protein
MNEGYFRFLVKIRSGTLWTSERKHTVLCDPDNLCPRGCGKVGSLDHILNAYQYCFQEMTKRPDDICQIFAQQLKHDKKKKIDRTIRLRKNS